MLAKLLGRLPFDSAVLLLGMDVQTSLHMRQIICDRTDSRQHRRGERRHLRKKGLLLKQTVVLSREDV